MSPHKHIPIISFISLISAFFQINHVNATHTPGMEITYNCLGNQQYEITFIYYRDCAGVGMHTTYSLNVNSTSCNLTAPDAIVSLDTFYELPIYHPTIMPTTYCNGGNFGGVEAYIYKGVVTLPQPCDDWVISYQRCCRTSALTTVSLSGSAASNYISAGINSTICNSSPKYHNPPILGVFAGQMSEYNYGAYDPEGDELVHTLSCAMSDASTCLTYMPGYSPTQPFLTDPINTFGLNAKSGQFSFSAQCGIGQYGPIVTTTYQVVDEDTIGYIQRDYRTYTMSCNYNMAPNISNVPQIISGGVYDHPSRTLIGCKGQPIIFGFALHDADGDTIILDAYRCNLDEVFGAGNWNLNLTSNAPYKHDSIYVEVQIDLPQNLKKRGFCIGFTDNNYLAPAFQVFGFTLEALDVEILASDTTLLAGQWHQVHLLALMNSAFVGMGTYSWTQLSGPNVSWPGFQNTIANPTVIIPQTAVAGDSVVIEVTYTASDTFSGVQCTVSDTLVITFDLGTTVEQLSQSIPAKIYPNPTNDVLYFEQENAAACLIQMYNQAGQLILEQDVFDSHHILNLSVFPSGMYFIRAQTENSISNHKIIKL